MGSRIRPRCWQHNHFRADFHTRIEVGDVLVGQPDTTGRNPLADGLGLVGAGLYSVSPRYIARAPSGLPGPPAINRGK